MVRYSVGTMEHPRERFLKTYANIPLNLREDVILVIDEQPISWKVAFLEVKANTGNSAKILESLERLELI